MTRKQKKLLLRILVALGLLVGASLIPLRGPWRLALYLAPYLTVGWDVLRRAFRGILRGQVLDENFLMAVATLGALVLGLTHTGDYLEAVAVMLLYQLGELFQSLALGKSRRSIAALMDIRPDHANLEGASEPVDPRDVPPGSIIRVLPGERIPLDAVVVEGFSSLDTRALTGESAPRDVAPGDPVVSGCVNLSGVLRLRTTRDQESSTVARILELVENASSRKSRSEDLIARFARIYTPCVCLCALVLGFLPPLLGLGSWNVWLYRSLSFLVASCPCALVLSIPLAFFAGIGGAGRVGILVKGSNYLEALAKTETVAFDKTGTLTQGVFRVIGLEPVDMPPEELLEYAALGEQASTHPIARSILSAWEKPLDGARVTEVRELAGQGITARVDGMDLALGNRRLMDALGIPVPHREGPGTGLHLALEGRFRGTVRIGDTLRPQTPQALEMLNRVGIRQTAMLTGDTPDAARAVARELGLSRVFAGLLPGDKVTALEQLLAEKPRGSCVAFVGDGINDAPVLARADVGIAMGALGSDAAIEAADVVLMDDDPRRIAQAIGHARKTLAIVRWNMVFVIAVKLACLALVALGLADMWLAVFADVGVMVLAVLNALRTMFPRPLQTP